ncbi:MAG: MBL fold metallo-hydrolase [Candidatus Latescibacteria bacterium]|nr:MBL fold metallo-hydrolase [Candidatus Latescibacterota bacterium]
MSIHITVLSEDTAGGMGLMAEHGFSLLVERGGERALFDTGQGLVLSHNAKVLDVDLSAVEKIVLSHAHYDHTGGLKAALASGKKNIFGHPALFERKIVLREGERLDIGCPKSREELEGLGAVFHLSETPVQIADGITTTGQVPRTTAFEQVDALFQVEKNGARTHDDIPDDLSLILRSSEGLVLLLGCCHSGLINTLRHVVQLTGERHFASVIGGTHLISADETRMARTIEALRSFEIDRLIVGHCTGMNAMIHLWNAFGSDRVGFMAVGSRWEFAG